MPPPCDSSNTLNYFETLFKKSKRNAVVLMNTDGIIQLVNEQFLNNFGYDLEDLQGRSIHMLFTEEDRLLGKPEEELSKVLTTGQAMDNNYLINKDQTSTWVSGESLLIKNANDELGILKIIQDIQQIKNSEISLSKLYAFSESILSNIKDAVIVVDREMKILKSNNAFATLFAKREPEVLPGDFLTMLAPHDKQNALLDKIRSCVKNNTAFANMELEIAHDETGKRIYDVSCSPIGTGKNGSVLLVFHDITDQKNKEREREDIIGFVAHELRNPLANILMGNEILNEAINSNDMDEMKAMLEKSKTNVVRLNKIIADLYNATKASAGNLYLDKTTFNFRDMMDEAVDTVRGLEPDYKIIIKGNGNFRVHADKYKLIQVVVNFLSNGIKYSPGNNLVILSVEKNDEGITVAVKDHGFGISQAQLPNIFKRFYRADRTRKHEGIGLGLYLCQQIIQAHKGKIWAESQEGKGSTFYFSLPPSTVV